MTSGVGRPELLGALGAAIGVTGATIVVTMLLRNIRVADNCVDTICPTTSAFYRIGNPLDTWLYPLLATLPFVVGGLLGAPLLARELETGTGRLAWSLSGSRLRWFIWRLVPALVLVVVLLVPAALAANRLLWEWQRIDPTFNFYGDQWRGAPLVARGLAAFGIAVLAGVLVRRILPALLVTAVAVVILYNGLEWASGVGYLMPMQVLGDPADPGNPAAVTPGSYQWSVALEAPDGSFHLAQDVARENGFPRFNAQGVLVNDDAVFIAWYSARGYRQLNAGWDASRYPDSVFRESASLAGGAIVLLVASVVGLSRSRPG